MHCSGLVTRKYTRMSRLGSLGSTKSTLIRVAPKPDSDQESMEGDDGGGRDARGVQFEDVVLSNPSRRKLV